MIDVIELKAKAYDCIAQIEYYQTELKKLNAQIIEQMQKPSTDKTEDALAS